MGGISLLWKAPEVNPINKKAKSIPILNPINVYGRVFHFSWFGFFIAFWAWFAFPPLITTAIGPDLGLSTTDVFNSNIVGLLATLLVRLVAGPACDRFGPRNTFAGTLLIGAIPSFCTGGITNVSGLLAVRFFVGILGGSFVPCQVWTTAFFDKSTVGAANALTAGWGNAGGGITYFVMPHVYTALIGDGLSPDTAWRVAFVIPSVLISLTAAAMVFLCPETPVGRWSERYEAVEQNLHGEGRGALGGEKVQTTVNASKSSSPPSERADTKEEKDVEKVPDAPEIESSTFAVSEVREVIVKPTFVETLKVMISPSTQVLGWTYFCSFGSELAINAVLGSYYPAQFPNMNPTTLSNWAAMFGLLNFVFRPLGGLVSDVLYRATNRNLWVKKMLIHTYGLIQGAFIIAIGLYAGAAGDPSTSPATVFGLVAGMAFFLEGGNGMNFSLVPHVHPQANGVVSGFTGAMGNFGGIIFACVFRGNADNVSQGVWIVGLLVMVINVLVIWIRPIPKDQIAGR